MYNCFFLSFVFSKEQYSNTRVDISIYWGFHLFAIQNVLKLRERGNRRKENENYFAIDRETD